MIRRALRPVRTLYFKPLHALSCLAHLAYVIFKSCTQVLFDIAQGALLLLKRAVDERIGWDTRVKSLSELSLALEIEEHKFEVDSPN